MSSLSGIKRHIRGVGGFYYDIKHGSRGGGYGMTKSAAKAARKKAKLKKKKQKTIDKNNTKTQIHKKV